MKILFIPHVPNIKLINRVYEFAKNSDALFLSWEIENSSLGTKIASQLVTFFQKIDLQENILSIPLLFKPEAVAIKFNTKILNYAIKKYNIDVVINANALLFDIKNICVPVIYDMVDDHLTPNSSIGLTQKRVEKIKQDLKASAGVVCVTSFVEEKVKEYNQNTITIENGVYLERFKKAHSLKNELGLEGKKVYGYIGGVEAWTQIDKACEAYMQIKNDDNAMIVAGDSKGSYFQELKQKYKNDILFCGAIPPEKVADYFKTLDIGLIPFACNDFTNNAFPIKALEYALGGARVVATPLKCLQTKKFPFIEFCEIEEFSDCMQTIESKDVVFDFEPYSWQRQTEKLLDFMGKIV